MKNHATDVCREAERASGQTVLDDILSLLGEERDAVLALDVARVREITEQKRELADRLEQLEMAALQSAWPQKQRALLNEVRVRAQTNALLMEDASESIAALLQCQVSAETYDARARIQQKHGSFGGRIV
ncbi:MAG: hypothetical protein IPK13_22355 [Deltaproteobacteria bacterium]|nr:hypothetical protein [Deltaproteobacteria bacterium]